MASWRSSTVALAILLLCSAQCRAQDTEGKPATPPIGATAANLTTGPSANNTAAPPTSSTAAPNANSTAAPSTALLNSTNSTAAAPADSTSKLPAVPPAEAPADKPTDKPSADKPTDKPAKNPKGKDTRKSTDKPAGKQSQKHGKKAQGKDTPAPKKRPAGKKSGQPGQGPADNKQSKKHTQQPKPHTDAEARQLARERMLARQLAADKADSHFIPIRLVYKRAMKVGRSYIWPASYWIRPQDQKAITTSADWSLVEIQAQGEHTVRGDVHIWKTPCGQLRWNQAEKRIRYTAEVDGCEDVITYTAAKKKNKNVVKQGKARIEVLPGGREAQLYTATVRPLEVTATRNATAPTQALTQQDTYFIPLVFADKNALDVNKGFDYAEGYLLRPDNQGSSSTDWVLSGLYAKGERSVWGSTVSWVTPCGYLQWSKGKRVKYIAEVDGCAETFRYEGQRKDSPSVVQTGRIKVVVNVDNCVYSRCAHPGCGGECKCMSTRTGSCGCGAGQVGFMGMYIYSKNRQACVFQNAIPVTNKKATAGLFSTTNDVVQVMIPFKFNGPAGCLPGPAERALEVTNANCQKRLSPDPDTRPATKAEAFKGNANSGGLTGKCNKADGIYKVLVDVPLDAGQYQCFVTFNDDLGVRTLAQLAVQKKS